MIVCVQGNIGSGKSTVLQALSATHTVFTEDIDSWSPWLRLFYEDMERLKDGGTGRRRSLGLQLKVLSSFRRIGERARRAAAPPAVVERSPTSSRDIFVHLASERGDLDQHETDLYNEIYDAMGWEPHLNIYLRCDPATALARIRQRARPGEETIDLSYIQTLHDRHEEVYGMDKRCVVIDANQPLEAVCAEVRGWFARLGADTPASLPRRGGEAITA